jgi:hypothetical protein
MSGQPAPRKDLITSAQWNLAFSNSFAKLISCASLVSFSNIIPKFIFTGDDGATACGITCYGSLLISYPNAQKKKTYKLSSSLRVLDFSSRFCLRPSIYVLLWRLIEVAVMKIADFWHGPYQI